MEDQARVTTTTTTAAAIDSKVPAVRASTTMSSLATRTMHFSLFCSIALFLETSTSAWIVGPSRVSTPSATRLTCSAQNSDNDSGSNQTRSTEPRNVHLVSWEGCLVDTVEWRTTQGLAVCRQIWPDLDVLLSANDDDDKDKDAWLYNKVRDFHHVFTLDPNYSPTTEYALLIRMLLEEQELDQGRSTGSRGKYGSKYHPAAGSNAFAAAAADEQSSFNKRKQRPLTVGEIAANWQDSLREAVLIRYHQEEGENPLELLQKAVELKNNGHNKNEEDLPQLPLGLHESKDADILRENCNSIIVVAPHESDLHAVQTSLSAVNHIVCDSFEKALAVSTMQPNMLPIVCRSKSMIQETLQTLPAKSCLVVLEASWPTLQPHVRLFGDYIPRQLVRPQRCGVPERLLQLNLWRSSHPNDQSAALMNAWTYCREDAEWPEALQQAMISS